MTLQGTAIAEKTPQAPARGATSGGSKPAPATKPGQTTGVSPHLPELVQPKLPSAAVLRAFGVKERACLDRVLTDPTPYVDHPRLHGPKAAEELFGVSPELPSGTAAQFPSPRPLPTRNASGGSRVPTLKAEDEQTLFLRINCARRQIVVLLEQFAGKRLTPKAARMLVAWGQWELAVRARIVELNIPLVLAMAKRTRLVGVDFSEMISEGNMALLRSVDKFDCGRGFKFSTYACRAILKSFSRVAIRASRYRCTFPVEFDPTIEKSDHLEKKRASVEADCVSDLKHILGQNMADLSAVEQTVITERFALDRIGDDVPVPKTLEQVGKIIGVTKERVRQIQNKALKKIRSALEDVIVAA